MMPVAKVNLNDVTAFWILKHPQVWKYWLKRVILAKRALIKVDKTKIPGEEWTWNHNDAGYDGVNTFEHKLVWFTHNNELNNNDKKLDQSFDDFIKNGPVNEDVPTDIMLDLYELLIDAID
jgi:hypothetical protein